MSFPSHTILTGICSVDNLMNSIFTYLHMDPCEHPNNSQNLLKKWPPLDSCPIKLICTARLQFSCPKNTEYSVMSLGVTCNAYRKCMCNLGSELASSQFSNDKSFFFRGEVQVSVSLPKYSPYPSGSRLFSTNWSNDTFRRRHTIQSWRFEQAL